MNITDWHWFALRTPSQREFKAMQALQDRGFATAVAYEMRKRRKHRRSKSSLHYPFALISRYLFVGFPPGTPPWRSLFTDPMLSQLLDGVVSVTSNGMPSRIRPAAIAELQATYGDRVFVVPEKTEAPEELDHITDLKVGDKARIGQWLREGHYEEFDAGAFAGHVVDIKEIRGPIAKTVMSWFGAEHEIVIPLERLAAA